MNDQLTHLLCTASFFAGNVLKDTLISLMSSLCSRCRNDRYANLRSMMREPLIHEKHCREGVQTFLNFHSARNLSNLQQIRLKKGVNFASTVGPLSFPGGVRPRLGRDKSWQPRIFGSKVFVTKLLQNVILGHHEKELPLPCVDRIPCIQFLGITKSSFRSHTSGP